MPIGFLWQTFLETPLINFLLLLTTLSFGSYGLAILLFTAITRAITFPLTLRTLNATRKMQELAPQLEDIKKKYSDPKRRSEEQMKMYREAGVNPIGCLGPQLIQMPVFIALYQVIRTTVGSTPEAAVNLEHRLYDLDFIRSAIPLSTDFLFIDLSQNGNFFLVGVVFAGMWLQQRISAHRTTSSSSSGSQQAQMAQTMQWMMPVMFAWFVVVVPAGLGLYWASTTIIGIVLQWIFVGPGDFTWGSLIPAPVRARLGLPSTVRPTPTPTPTPARQLATSPAEGDSETRSDDGTDSGSQRNRRRGRNRTRSQSTRSQPQSGRRRRRPRR